MKAKIILSFGWMAVFFLGSCKKTETKTRDYGTYNDKVQSFLLPNVSDVVLLRIYDTLQVERDTFYYALNTLYPGIQNQMKKDAENFVRETDTSLAKVLLENYNTNYYAKIKEAWKIASIDSIKIRNKYQAILGNIAFTMGEFGTLSIVGAISSESTPYNFPDNFQKEGTFSRVKNGGCAVASNLTIEGEFLDYVRMSMSAAEAGGCNVDLLHSDVISPPDKIYKYLIAQFSQPNSFLGNKCVSVGGISCAESTLSLHIEADGIEISRKDIAQVVTVAPIAWISFGQVNVPSNGGIGIYNADKIPSKNYKVYRRVHCKVGAGGIFSLAVAWNYLFTGKLDFIMSK